MTLRDALEADVPFLLALRVTTMTEHERSSGIVTTPARTEQRVRDSLASARIIEIEGQCIGLLKLCRENSVWTLLQLQLLPEYQGRGIGGALLRSLVADARAASATITLHVLQTNPAKRLYERTGFSTISQSERGFTMAMTP